MTTKESYSSAARAGRRIRALRQAQRMTTTRLGALAGFSQQLICQVELGRINTPIETLARIATALGSTLAQLCASEETPQGEPQQPPHDAGMVLIPYDVVAQLAAWYAEPGLLFAQFKDLLPLPPQGASRHTTRVTRYALASY